MEVNSPVRLAWGTKQRSSTCPQVLENKGTPGYLLDGLFFQGKT